MLRKLYAEEEAELIKQEDALKASRTLLTVKKDLEVAEHGLDAVKMVLDHEDIDDKSSKASKIESESKHGTDQHFLTTRYIAENVNVTKPPPDPNVDFHSHTMDKNHSGC